MKKTIQKIIGFVLVLGILLTMPLTALAATAGDVNSDGKVNSTDALCILKYSVGVTPSKFNKAVADVNNDGKINSTDALVVLKITVGIADTMSKADIIKLYNDSLSKVNEQLVCSLTISPDISGTVNEILLDGEKNPMFESILNESLNSDYEDEKYTFFKGKTTDGQRADDLLGTLRLTAGRVKSARAVKQNGGYKIDFVLVEGTEELDDLVPPAITFDYCEIIYPEPKITAVTDAEGRITRIDYSSSGNMKASANVNESSLYVDVTVTENTSYKFKY